MRKVIMSLLLILVVIVGLAAGKIADKPVAAAEPTAQKVEASVQMPAPLAVFASYEEPAEPEVEQIGYVTLISEPELVNEESEEELEATEESKYVYFDVPLDDSLQEYIQDLCEEYDFPRPDLIIAMIGAESDYREKVVSSTDDYGYMQINKINHETLRNVLGITDFLDGRQNVLAGVYLIQGFWHKYQDAGLALMCYNCGEGGAQKLWKQEVYSTYYSRTILDRADQLTLREPAA